MAANESLADALEEESAATMLKWGEVIARQYVLKTGSMNDEDASEYLAPYASALRRMMRAMGQWTVATEEDARLEWWNRIEQNGKTLYGDGFVLPAMEETLAQVPDDEKQVIIFMQNLVETRKAKG